MGNSPSSSPQNVHRHRNKTGENQPRQSENSTGSLRRPIVLPYHGGSGADGGVAADDGIENEVWEVLLFLFDSIYFENVEDTLPEQNALQYVQVKRVLNYIKTLA